MQQLLRQTAVENAPVVRVDGDGVAHVQPGAQEGVVCVRLEAQGDQVGGGADLDCGGFVPDQQIGQLS